MQTQNHDIGTLKVDDESVIQPAPDSQIPWQQNAALTI
jgi:hypothetical protein